MKSNQHYKSAIYYRAFQGMNPTLDREKEFVFNSSFESGNLDCAIKVKERQFDLFLRIDSNTRGHLQWYYFSVQNSNKVGKLTMHICNISKSGTLYESGLKPYIFSQKKYQEMGQQWQQGSQCSIQTAPLRYNIIYQRINPPELSKLTIQYEFEYENDEVYFAYCIPYTYSEMQHDIGILPPEYVKVNVVGRSLTGVDIPILHISNHTLQIAKKTVLITGRVHPGESNGSHLLKGFIQFLCSNQKEAQELRDRVNFIIVPMINPDGVIMGNSRTSAAGKDLNRQYRSSNQQLFPETCLIKHIAFRLKKKYGLSFFLDFHGHSRKKNTFFYGPAFIISQAQYYKCRMLPKLVQKINNQFRYYSCSFLISQSKKTTARAVMFQQFQIPYTFTIQTSVGQYYDSELKTTFPFTKDAWESMGMTVCKGLSHFVVQLQQFEAMVKQRRIERKKLRQKKQKQGQDKRSNNKRFLEDDKDQSKPINLISNCLFLEMIEEIKNTPAAKNQDAELSSDDHDDKEDLQFSKYAEFNALISGKKDRNVSKTTLQGLQNYDKLHSRKNTHEDKDQLLLINYMTQQKAKTQKQKSKTAEKRPDPSIVRKSSLSKSKNQFKIQKKVHPHFTQRVAECKVPQQSATTQKMSNIRKIISKKLAQSQSKCLVLTRDLFPESTYEFLELPKNGQDQFYRREKQTPNSIRSESNRQKMRLASITQRRSTPNWFESDERIRLHQPFTGTDRMTELEAKGVRSVRTKRKYPFYQTKMLSLKQNYYSQGRNHKEEGAPINDFNFEIMELDNMAMMIRTFNR